LRSFGKCVRVAQQRADRQEKIHFSGSPTDVPLSKYLAELHAIRCLVDQSGTDRTEMHEGELRMQLVAVDTSSRHDRIVARASEKYNPLVAMQHGHICRTNIRNGNPFRGKVSVPPAVPDETALTTAAVLERLLREYGPPLVLKSDNGSPFISDELAALLARHRVVWLPSPPKTPRYNGSCEAGNGTMKVHTNVQTYLADDFGHWTSHLMEAARDRANQAKQQRGKHEQTHAQQWASRKPITDADRDRLETLIRTHQRAIITELPEFNPRNKNHVNKVLRQAVRRALLDDGLLTITRRSITPPLKRQKLAKFS